MTDKQKVYKISYTVNLIPRVGMYINTIVENNKELYQIINNNSPLMDMFADASEINIFKSEGICELIEFKW